MSYSRKDVDTMLSQITVQFGLKIDLVKDSVKDIYKPPSVFASKSAADKASEHDIDESKLKKSSKDGRITLQDVNDFLGEKKKNSKPKDFVSKQAFDEATQHGLNVKDFGPKDRSGVDRKTKKKTKITIHDVRNKYKNKTTPFASKTAEKFAKENSVNPDDIEGTGRDGKIRKSDVEDYLAEKEAEKEENENSEEEDSDDGEDSGVDEEEDSGVDEEEDSGVDEKEEDSEEE